jgi:hypothetical protein
LRVTNLVVFDSVADAEAFVEPPDIELGQTFDADGQLLRFETDDRRTFLRETGQLHPEALRSRIVATFEAAKVEVQPEQPLEALVTDARAKFGRGVK